MGQSDTGATTACRCSLLTFVRAASTRKADDDAHWNSPVALALEEQILPPEGTVPVAESDYKPDMIVHPSGVISTNSGIGI
jgi:hypothetical protein